MNLSLLLLSCGLLLLNATSSFCLSKDATWKHSPWLLCFIPTLWGTFTDDPSCAPSTPSGQLKLPNRKTFHQASRFAQISKLFEITLFRQVQRVASHTSCFQPKLSSLLAEGLDSFAICFKCAGSEKGGKEREREREEIWQRSMFCYPPSGRSRMWPSWSAPALAAKYPCSCWLRLSGQSFHNFWTVSSTFLSSLLLPTTDWRRGGWRDWPGNKSILDVAELKSPLPQPLHDLLRTTNDSPRLASTLGGMSAAWKQVKSQPQGYIYIYLYINEETASHLVTGHTLRHRYLPLPHRWSQHQTGTKKGLWTSVENESNHTASTTLLCLCCKSALWTWINQP